MRVLVLDGDSTYERRIEPIGCVETGVVTADGSTIEFLADTRIDPYFGFAGRGTASWLITGNEYAPGLILTLRFPDGRGTASTATTSAATCTSSRPPPSSAPRGPQPTSSM
jgi:hypothetical protein